MFSVVEVVGTVMVVGMVRVVLVVEVVYRCEEKLEVKGSPKNNKDVAHPLDQS